MSVLEARAALRAASDRIRAASDRIRTASARVHFDRIRLEATERARDALARWGYMDPPGEASLRLARLPLHGRLLVAAFLATMGAGYASALLQLHASHEGADGKPGLTRDDVVATFHGLPGRTRLATMAQGAMREHLKSDAEAAALVAWATDGAPRARWEEVRSILSARCVVCHGPDGEKEDVPLVTYEDAERQTRVEPLVSKKRLIALTHIHVLAMGGMFGLLGAVFCFTSYPSRAKVLAVLLPFAGMTLDFSGWWLARLHERFCDMILVGGALTGLGLAVLVGGALLEVVFLPWLARRLS